MGRAGDPRSVRLSVAAREQTIANYLKALQIQHSPLIQDPDLAAEVMGQMASVLDDVDGRIVALMQVHDESFTESPSTDESGAGSADPEGSLSLTIGAHRAGAGVAPAQSLAAASLIFAAVFPGLAEHLELLGVERPEITAGLMAEAAIMARMVAAATTYVDYLLIKVQRSHREERRRLARELHDIAAPAVVLGLQNLDLFRVYRDGGRADAETKLVAARTALLDALQVIGALAAQSREAVGRGGLRHAIGRYAESVVGPVVTVTSSGPLDVIPASYCEELYLIVREALRNAVTHGNPTAIGVDVRVGDNVVEVSIVDDGCGFVTSSVIDDGGHLGLYSMHERAELLGGRLGVTSSPAGTEVRATVSLPELRAHRIASTFADNQ